MAQTLSASVAMSKQHSVQQRQAPAIFVMMDKESKKKSFAKKTAKILSIFQITLGIFSMLCRILIIILSQAYPGSYIAGLEEGTYCGIFFFLAGCFGLLASHKPSTRNITAFMTLSIIASIFSAAQIILASINIVGLHYSCCHYDKRGSEIGLLGAMILAALVEGVVAIVSSAVCCRARCCSGGAAPTRGQIWYLSDGAQPQMMEGAQSSRQMVYLSNGAVEKAQAQVPVQLGFIPQPVPSAPSAPSALIDQKLNELPSYPDGDQKQLIGSEGPFNTDIRKCFWRF